MELSKKPSINEDSVISIYSAASNIYQDQEQLQNNYSKEQFIKLVKDVSVQNILFSYPEQNLADIYDKILYAKNKVTAEQFNCFMEAVKQKNKETFQLQLDNFKKLINQNRKEGKTVIQSQNLKIWIQQQEIQGVISESLFKKIDQYPYISLQKLEAFLNKIQSKFRNQSQIIIPNRISLRQSSLNQKQVDFDIQDSQQTLKKIQSLKSIVSKYITDPMAQDKVLKQLTKLSLIILEFQQNKIPTLKDEAQELNLFNKQLENALMQTQQQLQKKTDESINFQNKLIQLTEQNHQLKKSFLKTQLQLSEKQQQNEQLRIININFQTQIERKTQETRQYATQFVKLKNQYEDFVNKKYQNQLKEKQEHAKNLFPTRSLKQQLEDANIKLKKLQKQKNKLLIDLQDNQQNYNKNIENLQKQLEELKNQKIKASRLHINGLSSYSIVRDSRRSKSIFSSVTSVLLDKPVNEQDKKKMQNILEQQEDQDKKNGLKSKFKKKQKIEILEAELVSTFDNFQQKSQQKQDKYNFVNVDFNKLKKAFNLELLSSIQEDQNQNKSSLLEQKNNQGLKQKQQIIKQNKIFFSKANIISRGGDKFQKYILITPKSIQFLDTKMRGQKQIFYQKIDKLTFCYNNIDIFLISFKRTESPLKKKSSPPQKDIIISVKERKQLIEFLHQKTFMSIITDNKIKTLFSKEEDIWVRQNQDSANVLSTYKNMYNPFRLILSWKQCQSNAFKLQLSKDNFLSKKYSCIAILQYSGLYCFQLEYDMLERVRSFLYLLPFVKRIKMQKRQKHVVRFQYQDWSDGKSFILKFQQQKEVYKFLKQCKKQIQANDNMLIGRQKVGISLMSPKF